VRAKPNFQKVFKLHLFDTREVAMPELAEIIREERLSRKS